jgi:hypothetical protein
MPTRYSKISTTSVIIDSLLSPWLSQVKIIDLISVLDCFEIANLGFVFSANALS